MIGYIIVALVGFIGGIVFSCFFDVTLGEEDEL